MGGKASIILVMGFGLVLGYISLNLNRFATKAVGNMTSYYDATAAHNLALAGVNSALSKIYEDTTWMGPMTQSFNAPNLRGAFRAWVTYAGPYRKMLRCVSQYPASAGDYLYDTVDVFLNTRKTAAFSLYAWFSNNTGNVFWRNNDTVWGRAHSNGVLHISGRPVFQEKVTVSKHFDPPKVGAGANQAVFKNGYETGVAEVEMPTDLADLINASTASGTHYTASIEVTLEPGTGTNNDGVAIVRNLSTGVRDTIDINAAGFSGVILSDQNVYVKGTLDGKLSVTSLQHSYITDDIRYEQNPMSGPSDDLMGLISERNIYIQDNTNNHTSCVVQSCLLARTGSILAENLNGLPLCGEFQTYGSVVQDSEEEVGKYVAGGGGGSTLVRGFSKSYRYDTRLSDPANRPPHYPGYYVRTYAIAGWWESYRITTTD